MIEAQTETDVRKQWIAERMAEFEADPAERDRAIATILYGSMMLDERLSELVVQVRKEGLGGVLKALAGAAMKAGKNGA